MPEGDVAPAEEGVADRAYGVDGAPVQFRVEEGQFGIDRGVGLLELFAFAVDAERDALGGDDVEDQLGQFATGKAAADGGFDRGIIDRARDFFVGTGVDGADVRGGDGAFGGVILADRGGDGRLSVDDDEDLGGGLGVRGQGEYSEGWQQG